jgi:hypothetical protein
MRLIALLLGILAIVAVGATIVVDVISTPTPITGQCLLARRILLPDICVNNCSSGFDCTRATRPYLVFFTQAASCMDAVIC